jgi:CHAD domain-containing protein
MTQEIKAAERGIQYWMKQVVAEAEKARDGFKADPVHDLRVAIRRCRSIGQAFSVLDPHPYWRKMRKVSKPAFSALGELRDVQVLMEWTDKLSAADDPVRHKLLAHCQTREQELQIVAADQLAKFDMNRWLQWADTLEERSLRIPANGEVFKLMALERWEEAHHLHAVALRNRSKVAMHELRIGIKKFRYIVENFLPELHDMWKKDMKRVQDLLGEIHDLDVLWETAKVNHVFASPQERQQWIEAIKKERNQRVDEYRSKMIGRGSLWYDWRAHLPQNEGLHHAVMTFFETWCFHRDPDLSHTQRVLEMSFALFEALASAKMIRVVVYDGVSLRDMLRVAVLSHETGHGGKRKHNKEVVHLLEKLTPPPGWTAEHLKIAALAARYHVGALPSIDHKSYSGLKKSAKRTLDVLAGIIRLAEAFDHDRGGQIGEIHPAVRDGHLSIEAAGFEERSAYAQRIASARYLLESTFKVPIFLKSLSAAEARVR